MDKNNSQKNANRLVYITVVVIICVMTVLLGVTSALNRRKTPLESSAVSGDTSSPTSTPTVTRPQTTPSTTPSTTSAPVASVTSDSEQVDVIPDVLPDFIMPVIGNVSKDYDLSTLVYSLTMNDYRVHTGIDIAASVGDAVYCAADGTVEQVWNDSLMGYCVSVSHSGNAVTYYKNLSSEIAEGIEAGYKIYGGEILGCVGESASVELADEPHLHFEIKVNSVYADPLDYLPASIVSTMLENDTSYED